MVALRLFSRCSRASDFFRGIPSIFEICVYVLNYLISGKLIPIFFRGGKNGSKKYLISGMITKHDAFILISEENCLMT